VSFAAVTLCVASQRVLIFVSVYFVIDPVRKFWIHPLILIEHPEAKGPLRRPRCRWETNRSMNFREMGGKVWT
jgi:hypothetical protein